MFPLLPDGVEVPDGITWDGVTQPPVVRFLAARLDELPAGPAVDALRDIVEWAAGLVELHQWRDPRVPGRPVGLEALGIIAAAWSGHPDYDAGWDVLG
jgi:hypothetical protein